jgi:hypothetical protein
VSLLKRAPEEDNFTEGRDSPKLNDNKRVLYQNPTKFLQVEKLPKEENLKTITMKKLILIFWGDF